MASNSPQSSGNYIHQLQMALRSEHELIKMAFEQLREVNLYLQSSKFHNDTTVQVADVLRRLDPVRTTLLAGELDSEIARLTKSLVATGEITSL